MEKGYNAMFMYTLWVAGHVKLINGSKFVNRRALNSFEVNLDKNGAVLIFVGKVSYPVSPTDQ